MSVIVRVFSEDKTTEETLEAEFSSLVSSSYLMLTKGSPEIVLERCTAFYQGNEVVSLSDEQRKHILAQMTDGQPKAYGC
jgi:Ca2+-transporting ATPase